MTNKIEYVIWGISEDHGYENPISSSYDNKIIPNDFTLSKSFDDGIDKIMFDFAYENKHSQQYYLYSIERVGSSVLYTIYRTGWKRGVREAYNALTLIINKNYLLKNPVISLEKLMSHYVSLSDSGMRNFNISDLVSSLDLIDKSPSQKRKIISNSTHVYQQKQDKKAFIKYSSENELHNLFIDDSSLFKFNKVFFFTSLKSLEIGSNKLINIKDFHSIKITIHNFNSQYHKLYVDGVEKSYNYNFEAYDGENIQILLKSTGKTLKSISVDSNTKIIQLDYIEPPRPKKVRKTFFSRNKEDIIYISIIFVMSLIILALMFPDERIALTNKITNVFKPEKKTFKDFEVYENKLIFATLEENKFYNEEDQEITTSTSLVDYFKHDKLVIDNENYFTDGIKIYKFQDDKENKEELNKEELNKLFEQLHPLDVSLVRPIISLIQTLLLSDNKKIDVKVVDESSDVIITETNNKDDIDSKPVVKPTEKKIKKNNEEKSKKEVVIDCSVNATEVMNELQKSYKTKRAHKMANQLMDNLYTDVENEVSKWTISTENAGKIIIISKENADYTNRLFLDKFLIEMESCECKKCNNWKINKDRFAKSYNKLKDLKRSLKGMKILKDEKK